MNDFFKRLLDSHQTEDGEKKSRDLKAVGGIVPSDLYYDPQTRMKKRLQWLLPTAPSLPGLPNALRDDE